MTPVHNKFWSLQRWSPAHSLSTAGGASIRHSKQPGSTACHYVARSHETKCRQINKHSNIDIVPSLLSLLRPTVMNTISEGI
jgi:hypothetical protein